MSGSVSVCGIKKLDHNGREWEEEWERRRWIIMQSLFSLFFLLSSRENNTSHTFLWCWLRESRTLTNLITFDLCTQDNRIHAPPPSMCVMAMMRQRAITRTIPPKIRAGDHWRDTDRQTDQQTKDWVDWLILHWSRTHLDFRWITRRIFDDNDDAIEISWWQWSIASYRENDGRCVGVCGCIRDQKNWSMQKMIEEKKSL